MALSCSIAISSYARIHHEHSFITFATACLDMPCPGFNWVVQGVVRCRLQAPSSDLQCFCPFVYALALCLCTIISPSTHLLLLLRAKRIRNLLAAIERTYEDKEGAASDYEAEGAGGFVAFVVCKT